MNKGENFAVILLGLVLLLEIGVVDAAGEQQKAAAPATPAASPAAAPPAAASAPAAAPATSGETGLAAVYNHKLNGRKTASGERYDMNKLTAAHKTLPFGTMVKVTNAKNQKSATVRINDRGPTQAGRILDISTAAAKQLGISPTGMAQVTAEVAAK